MGFLVGGMAFKTGLNNRSFWPPLIGLIFFGNLLCFALVACCLGWYGRISEENFLAFSEDQTNYLRHQTAALMLGSDKDTLYLVGGSSLRDSIDSTTSLQESLGAVTEPTYLGAEALTLTEIAAIIELLPNEAHLLIGINFSKFNDSIATHLYQWRKGRVYSSSQWVGNKLKLSENTIYRAVHWVPNWLNQYLRLNWRQLVTGSLPKNRYQIHPTSVPVWSDNMALWKKKSLSSCEKYLKLSGFNFSIMRHIVKLTEEKKMNFTLMVTPLSPAASEIFSDVNQAFLKELKEFSNQWELNVINASPELKREHFLDGSHLTRLGRQVNEQFIAASLRPYSNRSTL